MDIVSPIGKGGMGEVWKGYDPRLNRDVAIKIADHQFTDRFEREARAIAALNHKNVCTLYNVGPNYLVMEYIEGPTLADRIAQGPIPLEEALDIAKQMADGLEAAHEKAIVHRDLKPANVKIKPDGSVKVLDFGLAKAASDEVELTSDSPTMMPGTQAGMILGTAGYMSPEQARGQKAEKRADIWAFAALAQFGAPLEGLTVADLAEPGPFFRMGSEPVGVDVLTAIPGVEFDAAWQRRVEEIVDEAGNLRASFISREDLIAAELASGRPRELADVDEMRKAEESQTTRRRDNLEKEGPENEP